MDRNEFMELVYETFADESDNIFANGIIEAADAYVEHEKAQLSKECTTKDTISRQAAIDALKEHRSLYCDNTPETFSKLSHVEKSRVDELDTAIATLVNLPTIQPEPKEGKWEQVSAQRYFASASYIYRCSVCGENNLRNTKYCPNCGADMRGEKDG